MFQFLTPGPRKGDPLRYAAGSKGVQGVHRPRARMVDVPGMIRQASNRVGVRELLKRGQKDITLLSREKIDELINQSIRAVVEKNRGSAGPPAEATVARMQAESRTQFNDLLEKATTAAKTDADPTVAILQLIKTFAVQRPAPGGIRVDAPGDKERRIVPFKTMDLELGRGLDVGTVNICAAAKTKKPGEPVFNIQRNAFLSLRGDDLTQKMLPRLGIEYVMRDGRAYIVGDPAFNLANLFEKDTRRPIKDGLLSPDEPEALIIVNHLVSELLGPPQKPGEICVYSVPGDSEEGERSAIYHRAALEIVIRNLGYTPRPMLESHLIAFAELKEQEFTGMGLSCGGGKFHGCLSYKGVPVLAFSTARGGDWIDSSVAEALAMPPALVCAVKEGGMDLLKPEGRVEEAIAIYYRHLLRFTLEQIRERMGEQVTMPTFTRPIDLILAGGTSMIPGFIEIFHEEFKKTSFPIKIGRIRKATDPMRAVVIGCQQAAMEESRAPSAVSIQAAPAVLERAAVSGTLRADTEARRRLTAFAGPAPAMTRTAPIRQEREVPPGLPSKEGNGRLAPG